MTDRGPRKSQDSIIALPFGHDGERLSCKVKGSIAGSGMATLADWLRDVDVLILGTPGEGSLVVLPWPVWQRLIVPASADWPPRIPEASD